MTKARKEKDYSIRVTTDKKRIPIPPEGRTFCYLVTSPAVERLAHYQAALRILMKLKGFKIPKKWNADRNSAIKTLKSDGHTLADIEIATALCAGVFLQHAAEQSAKRAQKMLTEVDHG